MVSTRGIKFNFTEGERVLCYEPDPTKAKVLYDSKVLACNMGRDPGSGKKLPEYLVHFSGWNSSWDRIVSEDLILKDVPESRMLQRQLAEAAAKHLKGKKGLKLNKIPNVIKEVLLPDGDEDSQQSSTKDLDVGPGGKRMRGRNIGTNSAAGGDGTSTGTSSENGDDLSTLGDILEGQDDEEEEGDVLSGHTAHYWRIPRELKNVLLEDSKRFKPSKGEPIKVYNIPESSLPASDKDNEAEQESEFQSVMDIVSAYAISNFPMQFMTDNLAPLNPTIPGESGTCDAQGSVNCGKMAKSGTASQAGSQSNSLNATLQNTWTTVRNNELIKEFKSSILIYFDALLENGYLFYAAEEKSQWEAISRRSAGGTRPCTAYGIIHLLRFLVIMPDFLAATPAMPMQQKKIIIKFIQNFISFLNTNLESFLSNQQSAS